MVYEPDKPNLDQYMLMQASAELRAIAELFRLKRFDDTPPLDAEEINWGMSLLLDRLASQLRRVASQMETREIGRARKAQRQGTSKKTPAT